MTYAELKEKHAIRKNEILDEYRKNKMFKIFADADVEDFARFIAMPFIEELAERIDEILESVDDAEKIEIFDIYSKYYDGEEIPYDILPYELQV